MGLILFLDDGRLELDTNTVERAMRPVALGRKNALFAGSDSGGRHWAIVATLIQTAKLNDVDPLAWLTDVLERIVAGTTKTHELHTLLPWNWKAAKAVEMPEQRLAPASGSTVAGRNTGQTTLDTSSLIVRQQDHRMDDYRNVGLAQIVTLYRAACHCERSAAISRK